jgi:hypothetical protein
MIYKEMCSDTLQVVKLKLSLYFTYASRNEEVLGTGGEATSYGRGGMVSFTYRPLEIREENSQHPLIRSLGEPQGQSGQFGEEKFVFIRIRTWIL